MYIYIFIYTVYKYIYNDIYIYTHTVFVILSLQSLHIIIDFDLGSLAVRHNNVVAKVSTTEIDRHGPSGSSGCSGRHCRLASPRRSKDAGPSRTAKDVKAVGTMLKRHGTHNDTV